MIVESYARCLCPPEKGTAIAVARGGNIVGGGDWAEDRLIPDFVRAVTGDGRLTIRYPGAIRPWQHVLALVQGYLMLLAALQEDGMRFARPWNFGPADERWYSVRDVLELLSSRWKRPELNFMNEPLPEAGILSLDSGFARRVLGWSPAWNTVETIERTADWYRRYYANPAEARDVSESQLADWRSVMNRKAMPGC